MPPVSVRSRERHPSRRSIASLTSHDSGGISDDEDRPRGLFKFGNANSVRSKEGFHLRCRVVAALQPDDFWRSAVGVREFEKIGSSRYDRESGKRSARRPTSFGERFASKRSFNAIGAPGRGTPSESHPRSCRTRAYPAIDHIMAHFHRPGCAARKNLPPRRLLSLLGCARGAVQDPEQQSIRRENLIAPAAGQQA